MLISSALLRLRFQHQEKRCAEKREVILSFIVRCSEPIHMQWRSGLNIEKGQNGQNKI